MTLKKPESMDGLVYFTKRSTDEGKITVWVYRQMCPKCKKALMGKPKDAKGVVLIRAKGYRCPECGYTENKEDYENKLQAEAEYTCSKCDFSGEQVIPFRRKKIQGVDALKFRCKKCGADMVVAKKMKGM